jgi:large subunit ribosomal protein L25
MNTLKAEKRDMNVKAKKLRREGFIIGNLVGRDIEASIPLKLDEKEAAQFIKQNKKGSRITLEIGTEKVDAMFKDLGYDSMKKQISFMDFQALVADEKIHATTQITLLNEEDVQGIVEQELSQIEYKAFPADLVESIELDLSKYRVGDSVHVKDLAMAQNDKITISTSLDALIFHIAEPAAESSDEDEAAEEE